MPAASRLDTPPPRELASAKAADEAKGEATSRSWQKIPQAIALAFALALTLWSIFQLPALSPSLAIGCNSSKVGSGGDGGITDHADTGVSGVGTVLDVLYGAVHEAACDTIGAADHVTAQVQVKVTEHITYCQSFLSGTWAAVTDPFEALRRMKFSVVKSYADVDARLDALPFADRLQLVASNIGLPRLFLVTSAAGLIAVLLYYLSPHIMKYYPVLHKLQRPAEFTLGLFLILYGAKLHVLVTAVRAFYDSGWHYVVLGVTELQEMAMHAEEELEKEWTHFKNKAKMIRLFPPSKAVESADMMLEEGLHFPLAVFAAFDVKEIQNILFHLQISVMCALATVASPSAADLAMSVTLGKTLSRKLLKHTKSIAEKVGAKAAAMKPGTDKAMVAYFESAVKGLCFSGSLAIATHFESFMSVLQPTLVGADLMLFALDLHGVHLRLPLALFGVYIQSKALAVPTLFRLPMDMLFYFQKEIELATSSDGQFVE